MLQLRSIFMKYMRISCYLIFPVMVSVTALAEPLISLILTDKWLPSVPIMILLCFSFMFSFVNTINLSLLQIKGRSDLFLRILCIAFMWDPVMKINHNILNVKGRTDYFLYAEIIKKLVAFTILFVTIPFGVMIMCWGLVAYAFADLIIIIYFSRKITGIGYMLQLKELCPVIILNIVLGVCMYGVSLFSTSLYLQIILPLTIGGGGYIIISYLFQMQEWKMLLSVIKRK